jgi:hypothetical protein
VIGRPAHSLSPGIGHEYSLSGIRYEFQSVHPNKYTRAYCHEPCHQSLCTSIHVPGLNLKRSVLPDSTPLNTVMHRLSDSKQFRFIDIEDECREESNHFNEATDGDGYHEININSTLR